jgi:hypothetical protein
MLYHDAWELEDGFPCSHCRPRKFFVKQGLTWFSLWKDYSEEMKQNGNQVASYSHWTQYIHYLYPGLHLARLQEDVCDACICIDTLLQDLTLSAARRAELELEKSIHMEAAIGQCHAMQAFIKEFVKNMDPEQQLPESILPDFIDEEDEKIVEINDMHELRPHGKVSIQAEDFRGSLALPHFGFNCPSADYYNSNLILHNFVQADISSGVNHTTYYDERAQDKGANALCNLRLAYHLNKKKEECPPIISLSILDNCVSQNKSNTVLKFAAFLSLCFYERVILLYLIPGHSHMIADCIVAWSKVAIRKLNLFVPQDIVQHVSEVKSIKPIFLDHRDGSHCSILCWMGWYHE